MEKKYEGHIGNYSFIMNEENKIEVWRNNDISSPYVYIPVEPGSIDSEKKFHCEISYWYMNEN
jgi:hypothetical protein